MTCVTSNVPPADRVDIPALRARYQRERARRILPEGQDQYISLAKRLPSETNAVDPHMPRMERAAVAEDLEIKRGLLAGRRLRLHDIAQKRFVTHAR